MAEQIRVRPGVAGDLDDIERFEQTHFGDDQFSRSRLKYLLTKASASTLVLEYAGHVSGAAIMLWRQRTTVGRLYSIVIDRTIQGKGLGARLLESCEQAAQVRGCREVVLEVRADNKPAIGLYERFGYQTTGTLAGYYADGCSALSMRKILRTDSDPKRFLLPVPYYAQTLPFTCGPACLMMAMKHFDGSVVTDRSLELMLWKEATLIFMTSGLGGCAPFGLAVAAVRRGLTASVILSSRRTPFLASVRSEDKKEVIELVHQQQRREANSLGVGIAYRNYRIDDITEGIRQGKVPVVLIGTYRMHKIRMPHWVVVTGYDQHNLYVHDPNELFYDSPRSAQNVRIPLDDFRRMRDYGRDISKSAVFIESGKVRRPSGLHLRIRRRPGLLK